MKIKQEDLEKLSIYFVVETILLLIQSINNIDCQKNMDDTSQSTYQKCLIQNCISYFIFYVLKPDVFNTGTVRMFTTHQLSGSLQLGNTRVQKTNMSIGEGH